MKDVYKLAFMDMAERFGQTSTAERLKVGALIVKKDSVISLGVNGMPPGWPTEVCESVEYMSVDAPAWLAPEEITTEWPYIGDKGRYKLTTKAECRHAEIAALEKLWNSSETSVGAEMFVSHSPCKMCAIKIKTSGIKSVYYRYSYRDSAGIDYLKQNDVEVEQI